MVGATWPLGGSRRKEAQLVGVRPLEALTTLKTLKTIGKVIQAVDEPLHALRRKYVSQAKREAFTDDSENADPP